MTADRHAALLAEVAASRETLAESEFHIAQLTEARDRAERRIERVEALFAGGPDTLCRTTWREDWSLVGKTECVEVPMEDLRAALDGSAGR